MKRFIFPVLLMFVIFSTADSGFARRKAKEEKKMAGSAGLGITYPMGDLGDVVEFPIVPLLLSFQYAVLPYLSVEGDFYYYMLTSVDDPITDYSQYQIGAGARYWFTKEWRHGKTYTGLYAGAGFARTTVKIEMEYTSPTMSPVPPYNMTSTTVSADSDESYITHYIKGGYMVPLESFTIDLGIRYDVVDLDNWVDQGVTIYGMALMTF